METPTVTGTLSEIDQVLNPTRPTGILIDLKNEIAGYARKYIKIYISPIDINPDEAPAWNNGDTGTFSIKIKL